MANVYLTRRMRFSASHRLHNPSLSPEENLEIYGKCNNPNGHGHNYEMKVTLLGEVDSNGMVINLNDLKSIIHDQIVQHVDHKHLNHDVDFLEGVNPTSENLVLAFWSQLKPFLPNLYEIELIETENNVVSYRGE